MVVETKENSNVVYYIDENKKTVVCKINGCAFDAISTILLNQTATLYDENMSDLLMKDTYQGKAKCCDEDMWDKDVGKKIALSRALKKYYKNKKKIVESYAQKLYNYSCILSDLSNICGNSEFKYTEELRRLCKTEV